MICVDSVHVSPINTYADYYKKLKFVHAANSKDN